MSWRILKVKKENVTMPRPHRLQTGITKMGAARFLQSVQITQNTTIILVKVPIFGYLVDFYSFILTFSKQSLSISFSILNGI